MKIKFLAMMLAIILISCTTVLVHKTAQNEGPSDTICTKYIPADPSGHDCFKALLVLVHEGWLEVTYTKIKGKPTTIILNLSEEIWAKDDGQEGEENVREVLGMALFAFKAFKTAKVVKIYFSGVPIMVLSLEGENICVHNAIPKEEPKEEKPKKDKSLPNWKYKVEK